MSPELRGLWRAFGVLCAALTIPSLACGQTLAAAPIVGVRPALDTPMAREAIARVAYAEAAGQGDSGLAGVVYTILNRLAAGRWGVTIDRVVNARAQFEPVMRAGGDWRALPAITSDQRARVDTIINLALDGRLPDPTGGALYFQNPKIVAARAANGTGSAALINFGGAKPSVMIGDHAFYVETGAAASRTKRTARETATILVPMASPPPAAPTARGLFVLADGSVVEALPWP